MTTRSYRLTRQGKHIYTYWMGTKTTMNTTKKMISSMIEMATELLIKSNKKVRPENK